MTTILHLLSQRRRTLLLVAAAATLGIFLARPVVAQADGVDAETAYVLNTFAFLAWGALVMWMSAGFTMLEAGSVRTKNASMICLKNIACTRLLGWRTSSLATTSCTARSSATSSASSPCSMDRRPRNCPAQRRRRRRRGRRRRERLLHDVRLVLQMVFVAAAASIVSGALAERVKLWSFFLFTLILTAIIYPIVGAWTWGGGWLNGLGFQDFAGSTIVHSTGGWAALAGILVVGPRLGKFKSDGSVRPTPPSNVLIVTLASSSSGWAGSDLTEARSSPLAARPTPLP